MILPPDSPPLAAVVVHVSFHAHRHAVNAEGHQALTGAAAEVELNRVFVLESAAAIALVTSLDRIVPTVR